MTTAIIGSRLETQLCQKLPQMLPPLLLPSSLAAAAITVIIGSGLGNYSCVRSCPPLLHLLSLSAAVWQPQLYQKLLQLLPPQ